MKKQLLFFVIFCVLTISINSCAKRGAPTGGDKDITPPVLTKASPENMSVDFKAKTIRLTFDEYITLKEINKQLIISPPLKYTPEITPQSGASKYIEIKIKDTLKENTTYSFNFGKSIVDYNESNPYNYFKYIFSTGSYIDSLSVTGVIKDALKRTADNFVNVMLYEIDSTYTDSTIYKKPPTYITNTLDSLTSFKLSNLKAGKYMMVAMKDEGENYLFDQKTDKIAFLKDTITLPGDSIFQQKTHELKLFKEITNYRATRPSLVATNKIVFGFEGPYDEVAIEALTKLPDSFRHKILKEVEKDTLNYWFTPMEFDSIVFKISNNLEKTRDTFTIKQRKNLKLDSIKISSSTNGILDLNDSFFIRTNTPLTKIDSTKFSLLDKDSIAVPFKVKLDRIKNKIDFEFDKLPDNKYYVQLLPDAFEDFFGTKNDTLNYRLATKSPNDYGTLSVTLKNVSSFPIIVELVDEKDVVLRSQYARDQKTFFKFEHLSPRKYTIRVVFDTNKNGIWDTGNYLLKTQPERISYHPEAINLRPNWDWDGEFTLLD